MKVNTLSGLLYVHDLVIPIVNTFCSMNNKI